jgi:hypothetical protein
MAATALATVASLEEIFFSKDHQAVFKIKVFAFL